jgi:hypothetical protein
MLSLEQMLDAIRPLRFTVADDAGARSAEARLIPAALCSVVP